jgi:molecular chaperone GrpE
MDNLNKEQKNIEEISGDNAELQNQNQEQDKAKQEVADLKNQIEMLQDKLLRTVAEMENTRKRLEKSRDEARDYAIVSFAKDLLSVSDNLERALEYKPENLEGEFANVIAGVEMTKDELSKIFHKNNIEIVKPAVGQAFDYNLHNAISQVDNNEYDPNSVVALMQVGYKIKDRLLRPATVQVSKKSE